ncbi:PE PGRS family protein [Mycobacterium tuberculosis]|nr:PE PGRS family protein [Mycobacterium tuberculosis]
MGRPHLNIVAVRRISMSFVNVAPQLVSTAAADAARIGSAINTANTAAAATTQVLAAAQDEVSTAIAALFGSHGQHYQAISAQVAHRPQPGPGDHPPGHRGDRHPDPTHDQ